MDKSDFTIDIIRLQWFESSLNNESNSITLKEEDDLDAQGEVLVKIGGKIISKPNTSLSLSTASLFLMRTCFENYKPNQYDNKLIPHCGHSIYPTSNQKYKVTVYGCDIGYDWNILHEKDFIIHRTIDGFFSKVNKNEYFEIVNKFSDKVEELYKKSKPKRKPKDEIERKGYDEFWLEWMELKNKINNYLYIPE